MRMVLGSIALALALGVAQAQTPVAPLTPPDSGTPSPNPQSNNLPSPPLSPGAPASGSFVASQQGTQSLGSEIRGRDVYDTSNQRIGDVSDLVVEADGRVSAIVIGVGGFLGIGTKDVAVPYRDLKNGNREGKAIFVLNHTREELKNAPAFAPGASKAGP
jgi:sporulation protein YlmC with PRC-barrel domain